jgi:cell fate regulator YaaT (PSP1 superfamily)
MTKKVVGVRFKKAGKIYYFDPQDLELNQYDHVVVETVQGMEYGEVALTPREVDENLFSASIKPVVRKATERDDSDYESLKEKEARARTVFEEKVKAHNLDMKLINVEYTFDKKKAIFYFTAEGRVDFRSLVKDLASIFRVRIELRQIGVRDEAKIFNTLGVCGRNTCCSQWLGDFTPVSIKMAKEQSLSLNATKISGICGACCAA